MIFLLDYDELIRHSFSTAPHFLSEPSELGSVVLLSRAACGFVCALFRGSIDERRTHSYRSILLHPNSDQWTHLCEPKLGAACGCSGCCSSSCLSFLQLGESGKQSCRSSLGFPSTHHFFLPPARRMSAPTAGCHATVPSLFSAAAEQQSDQLILHFSRSNSHLSCAAHSDTTHAICSCCLRAVD